MASKCVPGLEAALKTAGLEDKVSRAAEWCEDMGARDLEEIVEEETFKDFAETLQLKKLECKRLQRAMPGAAAAVSGGAAAGVAAAVRAAASSSGAQQGPTPGATVFVKNTFIDFDQGQGDFDFRRLATAPPLLGDEDVRAALEDLLEGREEGNYSEEPREAIETPEPEMQEEAEVDDGLGLYQTMTFDGYEPMGMWSWAQHDRPTTVPEESAMGGEDEWQYAQQYEEPIQPMVGMVMVPAEAVPGFAMPLATPGGMCFPGCVAVPMNRFERWPGEHLMMAQYAAAGGVGGVALGADGGCLQGDGTGEAEGANGAGGATAATSSEELPELRKGPERPMALQRAFSVASSIYRVRWTVHAKKLVCTDREHVSPTFDLSFGEPTVQFRMIMRPKVMNDEKGGACFKKARGRGKVLLRCLHDVDSSVRPVVTFRIAVGNPSKQTVPRGPVRHDFSESPICGLPEAVQQWDFTKAVDKTTHTFVVSLEVLSGS